MGSINITVSFGVSQMAKLRAFGNVKYGEANAYFSVRTR